MDIPDPAQPQGETLNTVAGPAVDSRHKALKGFLLWLLNAALLLFLTDAFVSVLDDIIGLTVGLRILAVIRGLLSLLLIVAMFGVYVLCGLTPLVPKRFFVPLALFVPVVQLAMIPFLIYFYARAPWIAAAGSLAQAFCAVAMLYYIQGSVSFHWPLLREEHLGRKAFSWLNLGAFLLANGLIFLVGLAYLFICGSMAVDHFSGGFLALHADGLSSRSKTFIRSDHKKVQLIPMMHIGEANFYDRIAKSSPTNSVILLEGVTDNKQLLRHKLSYKRVAHSLGLVEQKEEFTPAQGRIRPADVDVSQFSDKSIEILNLVSVLYSDGWKMEHLLPLIQKSEDPSATAQLWEDLLIKRNANLLKEIQEELPGSELIIVPWGAVHMRGLAEEIQKWGFHVAETEEQPIFHFRSVWRGINQRPK